MKDFILCEIRLSVFNIVVQSITPAKMVRYFAFPFRKIITFDAPSKKQTASTIRELLTKSAADINVKLTAQNIVLFVRALTIIKGKIISKTYA